MDRLIHVVELLWIGVAVTAVAATLPLWIAAGVVWLLRRFGSLRTRLAGVAATISNWNSRLGFVYIGALLTGALFPVFLVAVPIVAVTVGLTRLLVPAGATEAAGHHAPHLISIRTMDWPLRLVTGVAIAELVSAAVLLAFAGSTAGVPVPVEVVEGHTAEVGARIVVACAAFLVLAWSLVLAGAWGNRASRIVAMLILSATTIPSLAWEQATWIWLALVGWLWVAALVMPADPPGRSDGRASRHLARSLGFATFFAVYAVAWWGGALGSRVDPTMMFRNQLFRLGIFLTPVLFLAGTDFAEMAEWVGDRAARMARRWQPTIVIPAAAVAVSTVAVLVLMVGRPVDMTGLESLGVALVILLVAGLLSVGALAVAERVSGCLGAGLFLPITVLFVAAVAGNLGLFIITLGLAAGTVLLVRLAGSMEFVDWPSFQVPFAALAIVAVVLAGASEVAQLLFAGYQTPPASEEPLRFAVHRHGGKPAPFSVAIPSGWSFEYRRDSTDAAFADESTPYQGGGLLVTSASPGELDSLGYDPKVLAAVRWPLFSEVSWDRDWRVAEGDDWSLRRGDVYRDGRRYRVRLFDRPHAGRLWLMGTINGTRYDDYYGVVYARIAASWRFDLDAVAAEELPALAPARATTHVVGFGWIPVLLTPAGFLLLIGWRRDAPFGSARDMAAMFIAIVGIAVFFFLPDTRLTRLLVARAPASDPFALLAGLVAVATAGALGWLLVTKRPVGPRLLLESLLRLAVGLTVLGLVYRFYGLALAHSEESARWQAVVLVLALSWDFLRSGKEITNVDGPIVRRPARVMMYSGYIMLVAACVLFISSEQFADTHGKPESVLKSEEIVRQGVVWLGAPLLLLGLFRRLLGPRDGAVALRHPDPAGSV